MVLGGGAGLKTNLPKESVSWLTSREPSADKINRYFRQLTLRLTVFDILDSEKSLTYLYYFTFSAIVASWRHIIRNFVASEYYDVVLFEAL